MRATVAALLLCAAVSVQGQSCGKAPEDRIVGGKQTVAHRYPWQCSLQQTSFLGMASHICGATLISNQWVLTAAHCVDGGALTSYRVVLGEHQLSTAGGTEVTLKASKIIKHPSYNSTANGFPNDIALMKLERAVTFNNYIQPACLPANNLVLDGNPHCWITGWGDTKNTGDSKILQELLVQIRDQVTCKSLWGSTYINNGHVCVNNGNTGACNGDSGGPLSCLVNGTYVVAGATSWGRTGCTTTGYPSVYTRVSYFRAWIDSTMAAN